jgi:hypothetical protein
MGSTRPNITTGLPKKKLRQSYILQTVSGEILPVRKKALMKLTLGWSGLCIWVLTAKVTGHRLINPGERHL